MVASRLVGSRKFKETFAPTLAQAVCFAHVLFEKFPPSRHRHSFRVSAPVWRLGTFLMQRLASVVKTSFENPALFCRMLVLSNSLCASLLSATIESRFEFEIRVNLLVFPFFELLSLQTCKGALREIGPFLGAEKINDAFQKLLKDDVGLHYGEFMNNLSKLMVSLDWKCVFTSTLMSTEEFRKIVLAWFGCFRCMQMTLLRSTV